MSTYVGPNLAAALERQEVRRKVAVRCAQIADEQAAKWVEESPTAAPPCIEAHLAAILIRDAIRREFGI